MCGRYSNTLGPEEIARQIAGQLGLGLRDAAGTKARNIAPTEKVLAIVAADANDDDDDDDAADDDADADADANDDADADANAAAADAYADAADAYADAADRPPRTRMLRWALLPDWATDLKGRPHINARLETVKKAGKFLGVPADASHRALILADEFIEWSKAERNSKSRPAPFGFSVEGGRAFCFAGLWSTNARIGGATGGQDAAILGETMRIGGATGGQDAAILGDTMRVGDAAERQGASISSCTILTCDARANRLVAPIHDRMPVIFADPELWRAWIDPRVSVAEALSLCEPLPAQRMRVRPLSTAYNDARNKQPESETGRLL